MYSAIRRMDLDPSLFYIKFFFDPHENTHKKLVECENKA